MIRHERPFRFVVVAPEDDGERYFGYCWTFWGAQRLARRAENDLRNELRR